MEEDIVNTIPEPSLASDPAPAPEPAPTPEPALEPAPAPSEPETSTDSGMTVVSVDELVDRLIQSGDTSSTEEPAPDEPAPEEPAEETGESDIPLPVEDTGPMEILGMDKLLAHTETIQQTLDHPFMTTSFRDYTVTEGLLLLILLAAFAAACVKILKGGFQWLRW